MIDRIEAISSHLKMCSGKCRRCKLRDGFSGECLRVNTALKYVEIIEAENAKEKVYCKDCIYCKYNHERFGSGNYECTNRNGLPIVPYITAFDYCSRGKRKTDTEVEHGT